MFCRWCGTQLADGDEKCPKCGKPVTLPGDAESASQDSVDRIVADTTRAARDFALAASQFTERLATKMRAAAEDPQGTATRTARRVARDLDRAREEIEKALKDL